MAIVTAVARSDRAPDPGRRPSRAATQYLLQAPPLQAGTVQAVVVLNDRVARTVRARSAHAPIRRLRQPVDLLRFWNLGPVRAAPQIALVNSNYVGGVRAQTLQRPAATRVWICSGSANPIPMPHRRSRSPARTS